MFHAFLYDVGQGLQLDGLAHERLVMKVVWVLVMLFQNCTNAVTTRQSKFSHKSMPSQKSCSLHWLGGSSIVALPSACTNTEIMKIACQVVASSFGG